MPPIATYRARGRVLVVDDEHAPAAVMGKMRRRLGLEPVLASSGPEALATCGDGGLELDLAVVDMIMPRMDGAQTFAALRALHPELPVVLCSGYDDDIAAHLLGNPRTVFLRKPFATEDLVNALRKVLPAVADA